MEKKENPNAFKHFINKSVLSRMADSLVTALPSFEHKKFVAIASDLTPLELKPRVLRVRDQLKKQLPDDFPKAVKILLTSLKANKLKGFDLWPYTEYIQTYGLDHLDISLKAMHQMTELFTAEFAVRPFLKKYQQQTLAYLEKCSLDKNVHVRRWASEGSRSRLPWGERLDAFIKDSRPTLTILDNLKFDAELYVRKSVSNHLNDMAKDHPNEVIALLKKWQKVAQGDDTEKINWIVHRALRTLIKQGHPEALKLIGANQNIQIKVSPLRINKKNYKIGDRLEFEFEIKSESKKDQKIVIDYIVHFVKSNKTTSPKVFKLKNLRLKPLQKLSLKKNHHLKQVTTRTFYPGVHFIQIQINGKAFKKVEWNLAKD